MSRSAQEAVLLDLLRVAPEGHVFPGRHGGPGHRLIVDVRGAISNLRLRHLILGELGLCMATEFPDAEVVAGMAKAGISWAAMLAERRAMPAAVIHMDGPRASGLQREVEGEVAGSRIVLLDNFVSSGESLHQAAGIARRAGARVIGAITIFADQSPSLPIPVRSLWTEKQLIDAAFDVGRIDSPTHRRLTNEEQLQC
jgi:orotate phosphoribosyltransferase